MIIIRMIIVIRGIDKTFFIIYSPSYTTPFETG